MIFLIKVSDSVVDVRPCSRPERLAEWVCHYCGEIKSHSSGAENYSSAANHLDFNVRDNSGKRSAYVCDECYDEYDNPENIETAREFAVNFPDDKKVEEVHSDTESSNGKESDESSTSDTSESMQLATKLALLIIGLSALGGPGALALTTLIVGLIWAIFTAEGRSPAAEKLSSGENYSIGRTFIHKALGGKGKR